MVRGYSLDSNGGKGGIDFEKELNPQQYAAVTSGEGPSLVIAGAGSGKTRTLVYRVAWLIEQGVPPWSILLLTFTNKAAKEMLGRVGELVHHGEEMVWGGTFHSFANRVLRRHAELLGYDKSFTIMDSEDQRSIMGRLIKELPEAKTKAQGKLRFPKAEVLLSIRSLAVNTGQEWTNIMYEGYGYLKPFVEGMGEALAAYEKYKQGAGAMDFDDLLVNMVRLFREHEEVRSHYGQKFRYVLVDEYQDTNYLQDTLVDLLVKDHRNLMVVGDDAQSIYSWRGADMNHILDFPKKYPGARMLRIEMNYRSVPEILELSNASIKGNRMQFEKELSAHREASSVKPALVPARTAGKQAQFVAQRIAELIEEGISPSEIAVLYRAHFQSLEVQLELTRRGISFQITSGVRFFEQAHIKDILSYLKFLSNPRDELSFLRMVELISGVGEKTASKLWHAWRIQAETERGDEEKYRLPGSFSQEWAAFPAPPKVRKDWGQFLLTLDELLPSPDAPPPSEMLRSVYLGLYEDYMVSAFENLEQRRYDIEELIAYSRQFSTLEDFLSQLALLTNTDQESKTQDEEMVTLSSIHQAKGLEWHTVFVIWLADGMFPHQRSLDDEGLDGLEEERRLFYVATTRAKDQLYLVYPMIGSSSYGEATYQMPSRFLDEYPSELMEEWRLS